MVRNNSSQNFDMKDMDGHLMALALRSIEINPTVF